MSEPTFTLTADEDLPRTIRREREAREREAREAREREERRQASPSVPLIEGEDNMLLSAPAATVTAIDMPFLKLASFFIKAVFAAIPALVVLTAVLWLFGQALQTLMPQLLKMKVDIQIYAPQSAADFRTQPGPPPVTREAHPARR
jgi:hypothetical protein